MKNKFYSAVVLLLLVWGCSDNSASQEKAISESQQPVKASEIDEAKTKQVLDHHWQAFIQNNMEEVMADYTEESVLITPDRTYKELEEIRENFKNAYQTFAQERTTFKLNKSVIVRDIGYILWQAKTPTLDLTYASDTFIIQNGKIISQTYAGVAHALKE
ncbi:nuclear transport factor 2 family protein [Adhaeribacter swui]|uniref:Nuclear transport factor 2 family protein n=1 Tax=Adhaeribacter swui TaxID=2086471 RepID=A0A7G7GE33_9BACT|nr:nuclear transport factor 2 family protein [Adhaeribacter swui]QNF35417.1 nuclear transport factor 2 family protein [Adhaeribacter swui]